MELLQQLNTVDKHYYYTPRSFRSKSAYNVWLRDRADRLHRNLLLSSALINENAANVISPAIVDLQLTPCEAFSKIVSCCLENSNPSSIGEHGSSLSVLPYTPGTLTRRWTFEEQHNNGKTVNYHRFYRRLVLTLAEMEVDRREKGPNALSHRSNRRRRSEVRVPTLSNEYVNLEGDTPFPGFSSASMGVLTQYANYHLIGDGFAHVCLLEIFAFNASLDEDYLKGAMETLSRALDSYYFPLPVEFTKGEEKRLKESINILNFHMVHALTNHRTLLVGRDVAFKLVLSLFSRTWLFIHRHKNGAPKRSFNVNEDHAAMNEKERESFGQLVSQLLVKSVVEDYQGCKAEMKRERGNMPLIEEEKKQVVEKEKDKKKKKSDSPAPLQRANSDVHTQLACSQIAELLALSRYIDSTLKADSKLKHSEAQALSALEGIYGGSDVYVSLAAKTFMSLFLQDCETAVTTLGQTASADTFHPCIFTLYQETNALLQYVLSIAPSLASQLQAYPIRRWFRSHMKLWLTMSSEQLRSKFVSERKSKASKNVAPSTTSDASSSSVNSQNLWALLHLYSNRFSQLPYLYEHVEQFIFALSSSVHTYLEGDIEELSLLLSEQQESETWGLTSVNKGSKKSLEVVLTKEHMKLFNHLYESRNQLVDLIDSLSLSPAVLPDTFSAADLSSLSDTDNIDTVLDNMCSRIAKGILISYTQTLYPALTAQELLVLHAQQKDAEGQEAVNIAYKLCKTDMICLLKLFTEFQNLGMREEMRREISVKLLKGVSKILSNYLLNEPQGKEEYSVKLSLPLRAVRNCVTISLVFQDFLTNLKIPQSALEDAQVSLRKLADLTRFIERTQSEDLVAAFREVSKEAKLLVARDEKSEEYMLGLTRGTRFPNFTR